MSSLPDDQLLVLVVLAAPWACIFYVLLWVGAFDDRRDR